MPDRNARFVLFTKTSVQLRKGSGRDPISQIKQHQRNNQSEKQNQNFALKLEFAY